MPLARRRVLAVTALIGVVTVTASCSSGKKTKAEPTPSSPTPSVTTTSASPTPSGPPPGGWLTGLPGPTGPVTAIKVDNAPSARPLQLGLDAAQLVYQENVEGGATRFCAMFAGRVTADVGPVRSARDTDVQLLGQYGRIVFGFSGANRGVLAHVRAANLAPVPQEFFDGAYDQRGRRPEAYNFFTSPARLIPRTTGKVASLTDVGLTFGALSASAKPVTAPVTVTFSPYSHDTLTYSGPLHGWRISQDGSPVVMADGKVVAPQNVIVQFVRLTRGGYVDVDGNNSPDSITVGGGRAVVLRDGRWVDGRWSRPTMAAGTRFLDASGHDIALRPGRSWVLLVPSSAPFALR